MAALGVGCSDTESDNPSAGTPPRIQDIKDCGIVLSPESETAQTGQQIAVEARLTATILEAEASGKLVERNIVNESAIDQFEWRPDEGLTEVPNEAVGTKTFFKSDSPGSFKLEVVSRLSDDCRSEVTRGFTDPDRNEGFVTGDFDARSAQYLKRGERNKNSCISLSGTPSLSSEKLADRRYQVIVDGVLECGSRTLQCSALALEYLDSLFAENETLLVSGGCTLPIDAAKSLQLWNPKFQPGD